MSQEPEVIDRKGASASIYRDAPGWEGRKCAALGNIEFESAAAGRDLLLEAGERLQKEGFAGMLGPMDGDTWHRYRVVSESDGSQPFMMEPVSGPHDLEAFQAAGFSPVSHYVSRRGKLEDTLGPEPVSMPDISVTSWDGENAEGLIQGLFEMSAGSFSDNDFFKPIGLEAFLALYRPLLPLIDPRHVLFAHHAEKGLVGFLFGMPDRLAQADPPAILKTYASGVRGVGRLLADTYHRKALELGHREVIHALMNEQNPSHDRSEMNKTHIFRRYALMGRQLQA